MAGLLDSWLADATTKDEFGMTQADRRQPLWSGLIKAGLLGVAAGGEMMPQDRAKTIGQIGGAIGDIPNEMMQYRSGAAQQALRGQQVAAGKDKLAQLAKVRALAATPEFQKDLMNLPPHVQQIVKLQIEAGDMDAVSRTMANASTQARQEKSDALRERTETRLAGHQETEEQRRQAEFEWRKAEAERKKQEAEAEGKPMTRSRAETIISNAGKLKPDDPYFGSSEYKRAHDLVSTPQVTRDATGQVIDLPGQDLSYMPPPTFNMTGEPPKPRTPTVVPGQAKKPLDTKTMDTISTGLQGLAKFEGLTTFINDNPDFKVGDAAHQILSRVPGDAGIDLLNASDPKGVEARAAIADIGSTIVHDRSGAAVTLSEYPRLVPFIPKITDSRETIIKKLARLQKEIDLDMKLRYKNIGEGSIVPEELEKRYGKPKEGGGKRKIKQFNPKTGKVEEVEVD